MNQVAVVIGGGQTLGGIPLPWACDRRIPRRGGGYSKR